jgi:hypothetical protein
VSQTVLFPTVLFPTVLLPKADVTTLGNVPDNR